MADRHLARQATPPVPMDLPQHIERSQQRIMPSRRSKHQGLQQRVRRSTHVVGPFGSVQQWIRVGRLGKGLDFYLGLEELRPADLAIKQVDGVLARFIGLGQRPERVAKQPQQPRRIFARIEMTPIPAGF